MGPFILIGLAILLIIIVLSICAYPFVCACIAVAGKKYNGIVSGILLLLTIGAYMLACTTLERPLDNWCYSVYAGIVLTPIVLYICTGVENLGNWLGSVEKVKHDKITIPLLSLIASLLFAIEGVMRMSHSYSIHRLLNYGWSTSETGSYWFYEEDFQYAGGLLFSVSLLSILYIGISFFNSYKEYKRNLADEIEKKYRIEREKESIKRRIILDNEFLRTFESEQRIEAGNYYNTFCKTIINALESSDEKTTYSFEYSPFNIIKTTYKVLLVKNNNRSFYFYPMGIVTISFDEKYNYIPISSTTVSLKNERKNLRYALPSDVQPIRQNWQHTCVDGSPDLRYKYNTRTYVYEYGILRISELILHVYRMKSAQEVVSAYNKMYSSITQIKAKKHNERMNVSSAEKGASSMDYLEKKEKEINKNVEQVNEVIIPNQNIAYNTPTTLEECFCDIIRRRGVEILKDRSMLYCFTSMYKDVDITEYKEVMEKMVSERFLYQFKETGKQNDFKLYNLSNDFARKHKLNVQKSLFITQSLVKAIKKTKVNN